MASRSTRMRLNARHAFPAPREALLEPVFDWRTVPTPIGSYNPATPAGRTVGTKLSIPHDGSGDEPEPIIILGDHE